MTLSVGIPENHELKPHLTVFGVGGAGSNAVNNMIARGLDGVDFVIANTDAQALAQSNATHMIQLGTLLTEGLGAGGKPEVGSAAAEESLEVITDYLQGSHMCFITAGMGGGTGTGAAPVIAQIARGLGILTIGVVTKPFLFEGSRRMRQAEQGIEELQKYVDTLIVIPNQNLFRLAKENTTFVEAFGLADDVLYQGVKGITDLIIYPGMVNLDFADIRSVMNEMGKAMMGTGEAEGEARADIAAERAIDNPLLDEISLQGARGILINITGGEDMTLYEVSEASAKIKELVHEDANIIFGSSMNPEMNGRIRVSIVATGIDAAPVSSSATSITERAPRTRQDAPSVFEPVLNQEPAPVAPAPAHKEDLFSHTYHEEIRPGQIDTSMAHRQDAPEEQFEHTDFYSEPAPYNQPPGIVGDALRAQNQATQIATFRERVQHAVQADPPRAVRVEPRTPVMPPHAEQRPVVSDSAASRSEKTSPRFRIGSVLERFSAHEDTRPAVARRLPEGATPEVMPKPEASTMRGPSVDARDERVAIPAFLRRTAN